MPNYANPFSGGQKEWWDWYDELIKSPLDNMARSVYIGTPDSPGYEASPSGRSNIYGAWLDMMFPNLTKSQRNFMQNSESRYENSFQRELSRPGTGGLYYGKYLGSESIDPWNDWTFSAPYDRGERPSTYNPTLRMVR